MTIYDTKPRFQSLDLTTQLSLITGIRLSRSTIKPGSIRKISKPKRVDLKALLPNLSRDDLKALLEEL